MAQHVQQEGQPRPSGRGARAAATLKHEFFSLLPAVIFFLVGFNLIALSKHVVLMQHGVVYDGVAKATIGALLVAKVVALADLLPVMKRLQLRPLWSSALLQAAIYTILCMAVHELEGLVRHSIAASGVVAGLDLWRSEFELAEFLFIAMWVFALFSVFVAFAELVERSEFRTWRTALLTRKPRT